MLRGGRVGIALVERITDRAFELEGAPAGWITVTLVTAAGGRTLPASVRERRGFCYGSVLTRISVTPWTRRRSGA